MDTDTATPTIGARVRINGWGLDGLVLIVSNRTDEPDYFKLAFEHNGKEAPGNFHRALLGAA